MGFALVRRGFLGLAIAVSAGLPGLAAEDLGLAQAVQNPMRSAKFVARDGARHPLEELGFLGLRPDATVVEVWPGGGYWTEILASYLLGRGSYYVAVPAGNDEVKDAVKFRAKIAGNPAAFRHLRITDFGPGHYDIAPAGSADFVLTFRNLHNWMAAGDEDRMLSAIFVALKPGGIFGVEDHRARTDKPQDPKAQDGYVRQDYAIALAKKAGFELVDSSEMLANPKDDTNHPPGVWALPPTFYNGANDHAKYAAIGEADNFLLKFRKPGG